MLEGQIRERKEISPRRGRWQKSLEKEELLFGFFGEVPGGWLQREEKKLVLAREREK